MTTFKINGCNVNVYKFSRGDWRISIGMNIYTGFRSKAKAISAISNYV